MIKNQQSNWDTGWWFGTFFIFPYIGNVIIPADFHIFQRGRYTTNQDNIIILLPQKGHNMAQQKCVVAAIVH